MQHRAKNAVGKIWRLNPKMALWIYTAIIRLMLKYGFVVWVKAMASAGMQLALERDQRMALTAMGRFRLNTPTAGLEVITHSLPLLLYICNRKQQWRSYKLNRW